MKRGAVPGLRRPTSVSQIEEARFVRRLLGAGWQGRDVEVARGLWRRGGKGMRKQMADLAAADAAKLHAVVFAPATPEETDAA